MPHAYRALVEREMQRLGWNQTQVAAASGLSKQVVSRIVRDGRERLSQRPDIATVESLAQGFGISPDVIWVAVAQSLGIPIADVPDVVRQVETASDDELVRELERRLKRAGGEHDRSAPNTRAGDAGAVTGDPDAAERRWEGEGGNGLTRGEADASTDPPVSDLERRRHEKHIKPATTEVDAARGEAEDEARGRSTKPPSPLGGFDPDEEDVNQDPGDDDGGGA